MTLRVGVVGAGVMGADHVRTLSRSVPGAQVVQVADVELARAQAAVAEVPAARAGADPYALVADAGVDAVLVASADATHAELVLAALAAGKPVLCEKPLAPSLAECRRVGAAERQAVRRPDRPLVHVGFMRRFDPGYAELRAHLQADGCGVPLLVHCVSRGVSSAPGATTASSISGSAVHEFDVVPWLLGAPVTEVSWHAPRSAGTRPGLHDPQLLLLRTADGVLSTVEVFLDARYGYDIRCEVVGTAGTVALAEPVRTVTDAGLRRSSRYAADWRPRFADAYRLQLQAWVEAVVAGRPSPLATAEDGLRAAEVCEAALTSMREGGAPVPVPSAPPGGG